ncbi:MAG: protein-glutamate O-methyltransferase CheR [Gammaproteobacteria bacterium]|nr:protein-glutamate O-methyltransferase CheR [Gammaproteobacteria bacterium]
MKTSATLKLESEAEADRDHEFEFTDADFAHIRELVYRYAGIALSDAKRNLVYSRLARRLRRLNLNTSFFRENHHFETLRNLVLPELMAGHGKRRIRIWSAGCSTGEEPYSIAMTVKESVPESSGWDVKILATDLDTNVLQKARDGIYDAERVQQIPQARLQRWMRRGSGANAGQVRVSNELQDIIQFNQLNLMESWPMRGPFDVIFCRNVVIYFDKDTQRRLFDRFADLMAPEGYLFVGHSETLYKVTERFELQGHTVYRKKN